MSTNQALLDLQVRIGERLKPAMESMTCSASKLANAMHQLYTQEPYDAGEKIAEIIGDTDPIPDTCRYCGGEVTAQTCAGCGKRYGVEQCVWCGQMRLADSEICSGCQSGEWERLGAITQVPQAARRFDGQIEQCVPFLAAVNGYEVDHARDLLRKAIYTETVLPLDCLGISAGNVRRSVGFGMPFPHAVFTEIDRIYQKLMGRYAFEPQKRFVLRQSDMRVMGYGATTTACPGATSTAF